MIDRKKLNEQSDNSERNNSELADEDASETPLTMALARFADEQERGNSPTIDAFVQEYPAISDELRECLQQLNWFGELASYIGQDVASNSQGMSDFAAFLSHDLGGYRILRRLGAGGMGMVFEAEQNQLTRRVALKLLPPEWLVEPGAVARFQNEMRAAATLDHPNIVNILSIGFERGIHFYAMRLISGETLSRLIGRLAFNLAIDGCAEPITPSAFASQGEPSCVEPNFDRSIVLDKREMGIDYFRMVAQLGVQAANALAHAHDSGVVHRDVKPSNMMLDRTGHLWVTDFGLARLESSPSLTRTGELVGTLRYMSPEQIAGKQLFIDHRTDIYSLGATLYELATLTPMINGQDRDEVKRQIERGTWAKPRELQPRLPRDFETILLKSVARSPGDRYQSCHELEYDLQCFLDRRPIKGKRPTYSMLAVRWSQRNPRLAIGLTAFCLLTILGCSIAAWIVDSTRRQANEDRTRSELSEQLAAQAKNELSKHNEVSKTIIAAQAWKRHDTLSIENYVDQLEDGPNGIDFANRILFQVKQKRPAVFAVHAGEAYSVRLSPDERTLASCGADGIRIWDVASHQLVCHLQPHTGDVNGIAWSNDGALLSTVGDDGCLNLFSTSDWEVQKTFRVDEALVSTGFSQSTGMVLACARPLPNIVSKSRALHAWSIVDSNQHTFEEETIGSEALSISFDGKLAAVACKDGFVYVWDLSRLKFLHQLELRGDEIGPIEASSVAFANRSTLLVAGNRSGRARLFDVSVGKILKDLDTPFAACEGISFSRDDRSIAITMRQGFSVVYGSRAGMDWLKQSEQFHSQPLWGLDIADDGTIFSVGKRGIIETTNLLKSSECRRITIPREVSDADDEGVSSIVSAPAKNTLAVGTTSGRVLLIAEREGVPTASSQIMSSRIEQVAMSPVGDNLIVTDDESNIASLVFPSLTVQSQIDTNFHTGVSGLAHTRDGKQVFVARSNRYFRKNAEGMRAYNSSTLHESPNALPLPFQRAFHHPKYTQAALTAIVQSFSDSTPAPMYQWLHRSILEERIAFLAYASRAEKFACLFDDNTIRVIDKDSSKESMVVHGGTASCEELDISPDGRILAVASGPLGSEGLVRLYNEETGRALFEINHYLRELYVLHFSEDGDRLYACGKGVSGKPELIIWGEK